MVDASLVPLENRREEWVLCFSVRMPPCGGLSEPSGPSPSAWGASVLAVIVSAMIVAGVCVIVNGGMSVARSVCVGAMSVASDGDGESFAGVG